jgi:hypothetical protein
MAYLFPDFVNKIKKKMKRAKIPQKKRGKAQKANKFAEDGNY